MTREVSVVGVVTRIRHVDGRGHDTLPLLDRVDDRVGN